MPLYDFRLRFNFPESYRIDSDADKLELLVLPPKERIILSSGAIGKPIKDYAHVAVIGSLYISEDEAKAAAEKSKRAFLYWAIEQRLGIDFGDGKQRSAVTNIGLAMLQKQYGFPCRNDIHGIDVYEHVENLRFVSVNAKVIAGKNPSNLIGAFQREYQNSRQLTEKQLLASEIYTTSFFDISARSRFITLVTAVEALLEPVKHSDDVEALVEDFKVRAQKLEVDGGVKNSIVGSLERLKYQSISQAGRLLTHRLLPDELFDGQTSADFFSRSYDLRSRLLHEGAIKEKEVDILRLANVMEAFVNKLLLAALNSESQ
jgi:hypothetical protein